MGRCYGHIQYGINAQVRRSLGAVIAGVEWINRVLIKQGEIQSTETSRRNRNRNGSTQVLSSCPSLLHGFPCLFCFKQPLNAPKSLTSTGNVEGSRAMDLYCKVSERLGILQLHERIDLHQEAWLPCLYPLGRITIFVDSNRGYERAISCDREDLEMWKGTILDLGSQGRNKLRSLVENVSARESI
jgi:hypothetical protein